LQVLLSLFIPSSLLHHPSARSHIYASHMTQGHTIVDLQHGGLGQCENDSVQTTCDKEGRNLVIRL